MATQGTFAGPPWAWLAGGRRSVGAWAAGRRRHAAVEVPGAVAVTRSALVCVSALSIWLVLFGLVFSAVQEHRSQRTLYAQFREELAKGTAPTGAAIHPGAPVALLDAPVAGLTNVVVVEGTAPEQTEKGPGHRRDTVLPGQTGVSLVYGRSVTFGRPFRSITSLTAGDKITATTGQGRFVYRVEGVRRAGDPLPQPLRSGAGQLTLATSESHGWRSGWAPIDTVYVDAVLIKPAAGASSPGHVAVVPNTETSMHGDSGALMPLVLWLQGLLLAAVGLVWTWRRWGRRQTWLIGSAVIAAIVWGASSSAALLLPNLL